MKVWAMWHGGSSYVMGTVADDVETFDSISAARTAYVDRYGMGHHYPQTFTYANRAEDTTLTPCVDESSTMTLWLYDPTEDTDPYPWKILSMGARGGVRLDHA